ncbi:hypothetical protein H0N98_00790 [Candidatus Micrarchaeota archaeon]|nr:hypothetical protein [Candidatus Micrarchaeota archaeon]
MRKGQTAMEHLMTYGWAILIIMVVIAVLFYLGVLNPRIPSQCIFPTGISCSTYKISADTGKLTLQIGQETGKTIRMTGVSCTQNNSPDFASDGIITYGSGNNITVTSGRTAIISDPTSSTKPWLNISCTDANGNLPSDTNIGTQYSGWIYVRYTEMDTNLTRTRTGTFTAKYEA